MQRRRTAVEPKSNGVVGARWSLSNIDVHAPTPVIQRRDLAVAELDAQDVTAINTHLSGFARAISRGLFSNRPQKWTSAVARIKALREHDYESADSFYATLTQTLMLVELDIADTDEDNEVRLTKYATWKSQLIPLLHEDRLRGRMQALASDTSGATRPSAHGPSTIAPGADERKPMAKLNSNDYGRINAALRSDDAASNDKKAAHLDSALIMEQFRKRSYLFSNNLAFVSAGRRLRYASTLFDGSTPSADAPPVAGTQMVDQGWAFFGAGSKNVDSSRKDYTISCTLTKAVDYENELYGSAERGTEYATPPGSQFEFEKLEGGIWYFKQI